MLFNRDLYRMSCLSGKISGLIHLHYHPSMLGRHKRLLTVHNALQKVNRLSGHRTGVNVTHAFSGIEEIGNWIPLCIVVT